jgi:Alpha amylase, catalytic domain
MTFPLLYQVNPRILLGELGRVGGSTLDDLPDSLLDGARARGFDWIWPVGVWQTGEAGRRAANAPANLEWYRKDLPDLRADDIGSSPFAITAYDVHRDLGDDPALARLRERLKRRAQHLLLDFVPNHVALDHPWTQSHPEYFIAGSEEDLQRAPESYVAIATPRGRQIFAHGRDPNFPGWTDTLQLNYRHGGLREAMTRELERVADRCDGVRCDMAMLLEPDVIARTWGDRARPGDGTPPVDEPFWPAAIARIRRRHPGFLFIAEVYWDLDWRLQQEGFDFTYDKSLYDRLRAGVARPVRDHLAADPAFRDRALRFLENHDEARAAAVFPPDRHRAAALLTFLSPGAHLVHEGQLEGRRAHAPIQLSRRALEPPDEALRAFYDRLLACLRRPEVAGPDSAWRLLSCRPAEPDDGTWDSFIVSTWEAAAGTLLVVVNFGPQPARCLAPFDPPGLEGRALRLTDLLSDPRAEREVAAPGRQGLPLELPPWGAQVLAI